MQEELKQEQESLDEIKRDHKNEIMDLGDDKLKEDLQTMLEDTEYVIAHSAEKQASIIDSMLSKVVGNYQTAFDKINSIIGNTGWVGSNDFQQNQSDLGTQQGTQNQHDNATQSQSEANKNPSGSASGTVTDKIDNNDSFNNKFEQEIDKKPNTDNRPVAELVVSPKSVTLQEGKSTSITTRIRPNDAKNKKLSWTTSNKRVATASNGVIKAIKPGSCKITVATTDGSGISKTIAVTVTAKPKPKPPKPKPKPQSGNGDGIPRVGDKVTFKGRYYHSSWGTSPAGNKYSGVKNGVVITSYSAKKYGGNAKKTGDYDVNIGGADGKYRDLGWVKLSQLSGYASGTDASGVSKNQLAWTQEKGRELIYRKSDNALLTDLNKGDVVFTHEMTENLMKWGAINPNSVLSRNMIANLPVHEGDVKIEQNIGSLLTVNGDVDKEALPSLQEILKQSAKYTSAYLKDEGRKIGLRKIR